ncbi:MAG: hypothetical protein O3C62_03945 [Actinomycetota bacterium]|nr:hypothetical protein [Actinomycetota bacterium]MDA2971033.1 hypothetical protein [Actinomycetota bacterium]MDA3000817.1 hypothetical protein [Actinomycetota bacterium]
MRTPLVSGIRIASAVVFVASIVGLIVTSINGNNEGWVLTIGMVSAITAIVLIVTSAVASTRRIPVFADADAEVVEMRVRELVELGADEDRVRELVRLSVKLGRGS